MKLEDVKFGIEHSYYCLEYDAKCYVVNCFHDDGAALIVELYKDGDISGEYFQTEACFLELWDAADNAS